MTVLQEELKLIKCDIQKRYYSYMHWAIKKNLLPFAFYCLARMTMDFKKYNECVLITTNVMD